MKEKEEGLLWLGKWKGELKKKFKNKIK